MKTEVMVVGFDGSTNAQKALKTAMDLAGEGTTIHVVTAFDPPSPREVEQIVAMLPDEFKTGLDLLEGSRAHLRDAERMLEASGIDFKSHFVNDKPAAAILDVAAEQDADLIVVGSRGLGRASRFLRGSVSSRIAAHAPHSFLVVHEDPATQ